MTPMGYTKLDQDFLEAKSHDRLPSYRPPQRFDVFEKGSKPCVKIILCILFILSILGNVSLLSRMAYNGGQHCLDQDRAVTDYVGLRTDIPTPFSESSGSLWDPIWNSPEMAENLGVVALSDSFVHAKNLPISMRFPPDQSKGVYVLSYHHNIHCLRWLRQSVLESHTSRPQSLELEYLTHCLNVLREDTVCHADDTPRYTGRLHAQANISRPQSGIGQMRKCRDFGKLYEWSMENSACYADPANPNASAEEWFKGCPNGRRG